MKKILIITVIVFLVAGHAFAEFQLEINLGYFFNTETYRSNFNDINRELNGLDFNIGVRYLFTKNLGFFLGMNTRYWLFGNNDEYIMLFEPDAEDIVIDEKNGSKLSMNFGLTLSFPINDNVRIQSDIGFSHTLLGSEDIIVSANVDDYDITYNIFYRMSSFGYYATVFGVLGNNSHCFTFGLKMDYKFIRYEDGIINDINQSPDYDDWSLPFSHNPYFSGFSIAPFIGYLWRI